MKLYNIKARFIHDSTLNDNVLEYFCLKNTRYILRDFDVVFTVYNHNTSCTHVTGVKSLNHLDQCKVYIKKKFNIRISQVIIDNQFYSHRDKERVLDMAKIFNYIRKMDEYSVIFEPELFIAMKIKHVDKTIPTCLLYPTGSYTFLGGEMKNFKMINTFIHDLIKNNTRSYKSNTKS